jgi:hypothetical protein
MVTEKTPTPDGLLRGISLAGGPPSGRKDTEELLHRPNVIRHVSNT